MSCSPSAEPSDDGVSEGQTDPKQLRKLKQQQLQQKFRQEMEARKLSPKNEKYEHIQTTIDQKPHHEGNVSLIINHYACVDKLPQNSEITVW